MMDLVVAKLCSFATDATLNIVLRLEPDASLDEGMIVGTVIVLLVGKTVDSSLDSSKASSEETSFGHHCCYDRRFSGCCAGRQ